MECGKKTTDINGHAGDIVSISLASDGNRYVTGSVDKTCKLWDLREEAPKQTFFGHEADVNSVCVSINRIKRYWHKILKIYSFILSFIQMAKHLRHVPKIEQRVFSICDPISKLLSTLHQINGVDLHLVHYH